MIKPTLTKNRHEVFDLLKHNHSAMSAYDILDELHLRDPKWKPATVYRALNYLIEEKLIHRIESQQKYISCTHQHTKDEKHFLVCDQCHLVVEQNLNAKALALFENLAQTQGFQLRTPYLEFRGICRACGKL